MFILSLISTLVIILNARLFVLSEAIIFQPLKLHHFLILLNKNSIDCTCVSEEMKSNVLLFTFPLLFHIWFYFISFKYTISILPGKVFDVIYTYVYY